MKMIFVGVFSSPFSTNHCQARGFEHHGVKVMRYDYRERLDNLGGQLARDEELISLIKREKPKLVLFSKCSRMDIGVVNAANEVSKTILWYMDASNNFSGELCRKIEAVDLALTSHEQVLSGMLDLNAQSHFIHACPDEQQNYLMPKCKKTIDTLFIGTSDNPIHSDRSKYLELPFVTHLQGVFGHDHNVYVNQSKINLSFAPTDASGVSVRLYKIMATGGFVLTTPWSGMQETFTIGRHLDVFSDVSELKDKVEFYLKHHDLRQEIAMNGYSLVQSNYMPQHWAKKILEKI